MIVEIALAIQYAKKVLEAALNYQMLALKPLTLVESDTRCRVALSSLMLNNNAA
jgi:hypothetical protein